MMYNVHLSVHHIPHELVAKSYSKSDQNLKLSSMFYSKKTFKKTRLSNFTHGFSNVQALAEKHTLNRENLNTLNKSGISYM